MGRSLNSTISATHVGEFEMAPDSQINFSNDLIYRFHSGLNSEPGFRHLFKETVFGSLQDRTSDPRSLCTTTENFCLICKSGTGSSLNAILIADSVLLHLCERSLRISIFILPSKSPKLPGFLF